MNTLTRWSTPRRTPVALILNSTLALTAAAGNVNGMSMPAPAAKARLSAKQGHTTGRVIRIDSAEATITIAHHKVETLRSPAMTMTFRARRPELQGIRAGDRVEFTFEVRNGSAAVTQIRKIG